MILRGGPCTVRQRPNLGRGNPYHRPEPATAGWRWHWHCPLLPLTPSPSPSAHLSCQPQPQPLEYWRQHQNPPLRREATEASVPVFPNFTFSSDHPRHHHRFSPSPSTRFDFAAPIIASICYFDPTSFINCTSTLHISPVLNRHTRLHPRSSDISLLRAPPTLQLPARHSPPLPTTRTVRASFVTMSVEIEPFELNFQRTSSRITNMCRPRYGTDTCAHRPLYRRGRADPDDQEPQLHAHCLQGMRKHPLEHKDLISILTMPRSKQPRRSSMFLSPSTRPQAATNIPPGTASAQMPAALSPDRTLTSRVCALPLYVAFTDTDVFQSSSKL